ncbi:hypothetical protein D4R42_04060 [bacterium]|nr:MAG: hypothetical protein D4R42_04060 [bacterium]
MPDTKDTSATIEDAAETTESLPSQMQYICSVCGKPVVPKEVQTARGIRYQCPECKKFMKPLTPEDVEQREAAETKIAPLEIEMTTRVKELLQLHLPKVYGIPALRSSARITAIIDTLSPQIATNPFNLHNHIKRYAPSADDQHLESIINTVFAQLESEGYKPGISSQFIPSYGTPAYVAYQPHYPTAPPYPTANPQYPPQYPAGQSPPQQVKVIVDGQEITTDLQGSMAWKKYLDEQKITKAEEEDRAEQKRQRQETHDLEKQKFQQEIKNLAGAEGGKDGTLVEVKIGEQTIKVPAAIAPFYLMNQRKESPEVAALKTTLDATQQEIKELRESANKKQIDDLQGSISALAEKMDKQPTFVEQLKSFDELAGLRGFSPTGKTTLDVLSEIGKNVDGRAQQMLNRMPTVDSFTPDVKRTAEERKKKAAGLQDNLEKKEGILVAEDALIAAASKMG